MTSFHAICSKYDLSPDALPLSSLYTASIRKTESQVKTEWKYL